MDTGKNQCLLRHVENRAKERPAQNLDAPKLLGDCAGFGEGEEERERCLLRTREVIKRSEALSDESA